MVYCIVKRNVDTCLNTHIYTQYNIQERSAAKKESVQKAKEYAKKQKSKK